MSLIIVGNSQKLLDSNKGAVIDSFDEIIRLNLGAPCPKNYQHIGKRTTGWSASTDLAKWEKWRKMYPKDIDVYYLNMRLYKKNPKILDMAIVNNTLSYNDFIEKFGYDRPSTGLITINYIVEQCNRTDVSIIGFDFFESPTWYRSDPRHGPHDGELEQKYISNLGVNIL